MGQILDQLLAHVARAAQAATLLPPASREEILSLERRFGAPLGPEFKSLIERTGGYDLRPFGTVDFRAIAPFEFSGTPTGIPLAADGEGNFWILDSPRNDSAVLFVSHDPPVIGIQASDLGRFIDQTFATKRASELAVPLLERVWKANPDARPRRDLVASRDEVLRAFAASVPDGFGIVDLRSKQEAAGLAWGVRGPDSQVIRSPNALLLAAPL